LLNLGADVFSDYTVSDVANAVTDVDLALDTVGGATTRSLVPTLREGGTLVTIAYPPETPPQLQRLRVKPLVMRPDAKELALISEPVASGAVRVEISQQFHLDQVQRAHTASEFGHRPGKIVSPSHPDDTVTARVRNPFRLDQETSIEEGGQNDANTGKLAAAGASRVGHPAAKLLPSGRPLLSVGPCAC
jgi:hypothetical protein